MYEFCCNTFDLRGSDDSPPSINGLSGEDCQVRISQESVLWVRNLGICTLSKKSWNLYLRERNLVIYSLSLSQDKKGENEINVKWSLFCVEICLKKTENGKVAFKISVQQIDRFWQMDRYAECPSSLKDDLIKCNVIWPFTNRSEWLHSFEYLIQLQIKS